ncbi:MAG TPA: FecR domain-containing protein [Steroidobacteraceae bacterium]|nr:FecR domain-containing protein [Steroidobacteraceae bacterium]
MSEHPGFVTAGDDHFDEAAAWHARWRNASESGLSAEEVDRWAEWSKVAENKSAYDAVEFVSGSLRCLKPPPLPTAEELAADDSDGSISAWQATAAHAVARQPAVRWRRAAFFAMAATIVAVGFAPVMHWLNLRGPEPDHIISTTAGELKQVTLPDGSRVTLGAKTEIAVHYAQCMRTILLNNGEALFDVEHDPKCPFTVIAGDGAITAVGTEFSVRRTLDRVTVQVAEGAVNVQPRDALASVPWPKVTEVSNISWPDAKLAQGQEVTYRGNQSRTPVESEDSRVATEWLDGRREYHHEPLAYLIADINRYVEEPIEMDPDVGELQFSGLVYESQVKTFLQDLEIIFPVKVSRTAQNHILIQARDGVEPKKLDGSP